MEEAQWVGHTSDVDQPEVTHVTTERVTHGMLVQVVGTVSGHVADRC
jgi:hypothetical protein